VEWQLALLLIFGSLFILLALGMPVVVVFMLLNVMGALVFWGGEAGLEQLILSLRYSVTRFVLMPLPLFILMGELIFQSGLAPLVIDAVDKWLVRLPGRLGLLAVAAGTVFSTLTGASLGSCAMLGSTLVPEMERRGYKKQMTLGPVLGSGGLAVMIPPSGLAVFLGAIAQVSVGKLLIAIIVPGLTMAVLYATYIVIRCQLQPSLAPPYDVPPTPVIGKIVPTAKYILPVGFIIFLVVGVIFLGVATPTEAAATGALGSFILCAFYRKLNWQVVKKSFIVTTRITGMIFFIIAGAIAFSQTLALSGASQGVIQFVQGLPLAPIIIIIAMQVIVMILGMFVDVGAIIMITIPLFMPIVLSLGFDPVWFAVIFLLNLEMALVSPPFGMDLFVMKGVAPPDTTMADIYRASLPFLGCDVTVMALMIGFPAIALWLPGLMS